MNVRFSRSGALRSGSFTDARIAECVPKRVSLFLIVVLVLLTTMSPPIQRGEAGRSRLAAFDFSAPPGMFLVGEKLEYDVSYSIFSLGTVSIEIFDTTQKDGSMVYRANAFMDSYSGVPFVNLHWAFYSEIDPQLHSHFFSGVDRKDSTKTSYANYSFEYRRGRVFVEKGIKQQRDPLTKESDTISTTYQDGLSLFFYARGNVHSKKEVNVPTFVNEKKVNTYINFMNKRTTSEIDAVKYPVETIQFDGRADFVGIFGLTGGFSGWFSNDAAAVPIVAKMKVLLGSVRLELVRWNRPGWVPPRAADE